MKSNVVQCQNYILNIGCTDNYAHMHAVVCYDMETNSYLMSSIWQLFKICSKLHCSPHQQSSFNRSVLNGGNKVTLVSL